LKDSSNREIASLRHTSAQYLSALLSSVQGLKKFLDKEGGKEISLNSIYSQSQNITLADHLKTSEKLILSITDMLLNNSTERVQSVPVDLLKVIREAQNFYTNRNFYFEELRIDNSTFGKNASISELFVLVDGDSFLNLFSNVISNAISHGFKNRIGQNIIRTSIYFDNDENKCVLEISNNGLPLAEDFDFMRLATWGEKTSDSEGKGIGGADILKLMENHGGKFELLSNPSDVFPVTYKLNFKIYIDVI
jgi:light-regulated signal transduction histidine kinase (bacteriophytochrome)